MGASSVPPADSSGSAAEGEGVHLRLRVSGQAAHEVAEAVCCERMMWQLSVPGTTRPPVGWTKRAGPFDARCAAWVITSVVAGLVLLARPGLSQAQATAASASAGRPALTVSLVSPQSSVWPQRVTANGNIAAWQEVVVASEVGGWRLAEVVAQVGDVVRKGQVLARFATDMLEAEVAQTRAALAEARALRSEAIANADRARELQPTGVFSVQQTQQILTAEATAKARVESMEARLKADQLRLAHARVVAPDDGVVSARAAVEGAIAQPGQELFRLIRRGRLEWRAEVTAADLGRIRPGMPVSLTTPSGQAVRGQVRVVAPTVDAATRNGVVQVDLTTSGDARAGMFARGEIEIGSAAALSLPQAAVVLRDGFAYVMRLGPEQRVALNKVTLGRRLGDRVEIISGLAPDARVVGAGAAFLADGDRVRVVDAASAVPSGAASAAQGRSSAASR